MKTADTKATVLVIDDEFDIRDRLKNMLQRRGYAVLTAENGKEGLEKVRNNDVDVVFCDICMPEMGGLAFLENVHKISLKVEVIMVTANSSVERCVASIEKNACNYLIKPVKLDVILENLAIAVQRVQEKKHMLKRALLMAHRKGHEGLACKT